MRLLYNIYDFVCDMPKRPNAVTMVGAAYRSGVAMGCNAVGSGIILSREE